MIIGDAMIPFLLSQFEISVLRSPYSRLTSRPKIEYEGYPLTLNLTETTFVKFSKSLN